MKIIDNDQDWYRFLKSPGLLDDPDSLLPLQRMQELAYEWRPETELEFRTFIAAALPSILEGFGFICYDTLPVTYHWKKKEVTLLTGTNKSLYLFPEEWYEIIPEGYKLICITGEQLSFERGVTDNGTRAGCLSYGIAVPRP